MTPQVNPWRFETQDVVVDENQFTGYSIDLDEFLGFENVPTS
jgi:hypothetical protein